MTTERILFFFFFDSVKVFLLAFASFMPAFGRRLDLMRGGVSWLCRTACFGSRYLGGEAEKRREWGTAPKRRWAGGRFERLTLQKFIGEEDHRRVPGRFEAGLRQVGQRLSPVKVYHVHVPAGDQEEGPFGVQVLRLLGGIHGFLEDFSGDKGKGADDGLQPNHQTKTNK